MKKYKFLTILFMAMLTIGMMTACGNDDDERSGGDDNVLVGTWVGTIQDVNKWTIVFNGNGTGSEKWEYLDKNKSQYNGQDSFNYTLMYYDSSSGRGMITILYTTGEYSGKSYNREFTLISGTLSYDGILLKKK